MNFKVAGLVRKHFMSLPERAQELFFYIMENSEYCKENPYTPFGIIGFDCDGCESPIEKIFYIAFKYVVFFSDYSFIYLLPQEEIRVGKKKYRVDFLFSSEEMESPNYKTNKNYNLVIECDGHDFHEKTKEQVAKGNDRDYDLKSVGYDVIHFSGSQIYNDPIGCAEKTFEYIKINTSFEKVCE